MIYKLKEIADVYNVHVYSLTIYYQTILRVVYSLIKESE